MTTDELSRLRLLQRVLEGGRSRREAAADLGVCERQLRRMLRRLEAQGAQSVISQRRGNVPNNRLDDELRSTVLSKYRADYVGFGPTFLAQTLRERDVASCLPTASGKVNVVGAPCTRCEPADRASEN
jgi:transposase